MGSNQLRRHPLISFRFSRLSVVSFINDFVSLPCSSDQQKGQAVDGRVNWRGMCRAVRRQNESLGVSLSGLLSLVAEECARTEGAPECTDHDREQAYQGRQSVRRIPGGPIQAD